MRLRIGGLIGLSLALLWPLAVNSQETSTVRTIVDDTKVFLRPNTTSSAITVLPIGTVLAVEAKAGDWYRVSLPASPDGFRRIGFVQSSLVEQWNSSAATVDQQKSVGLNATDHRQHEADKSSGASNKQDTDGKVNSRGLRAQLSPTQIDEAIKSGKRKAVSDVGLQLRSWSIGALGLRVVLFTPTTWIELAAATATANFKPFQATDVTQEMREPVLRVFITMGITNVVLRNEAQRRVVQASKKSRCGDTLVSFGGESSYAMYSQCQEFDFALAALNAIRQSEDDEFYVTATGLTSRGTRSHDFLIKTKHFSDLP